MLDRKDLFEIVDGEVQGFLKNRDGQNKLHQLILTGYTYTDKDILEGDILTLDEKMTLVNDVDNARDTSLMYAVRYRNLDIAPILMFYGANPNFQCGIRCITPFMFAAEKGDLAMLQLMIDNGVSIGYKNKNGYDAIYFAAKNGALEAVMMLIKAGAKDLNCLYDDKTVLDLLQSSIPVDNFSSVHEGWLRFRYGMMEHADLKGKGFVGSPVTTAEYVISNLIFLSIFSLIGVCVKENTKQEELLYLVDFLYLGCSAIQTCYFLGTNTRNKLLGLVQCQIGLMQDTTNWESYLASRQEEQDVSDCYAIS